MFTLEALSRRYLAHMPDQHRVLLLASALLFLGSCKKDKADELPVVRILFPAAGSTLLIPDTITVRVQAEDDRLVGSVTVMLTDGNGVPIGPQAQTIVNTSSTTVDLELAVTGERIESGTYTLVARVSDGDQDGFAFQDMVVQATPLRLRSVFVLPPVNEPAPYPITRIDSLGDVSTWMTLSELSGAAIDLDHLFVGGTTSQGLVKVDVNTGAPTQLLTNMGVGTDPYFQGIVIDPSDARLYTGTLDGTIRGFFPTGNGSFTAQSPPGWYSEFTLVVDDQLVSAAFNPIPAQRKIIGYDLLSGTLLAQYPLDNEPVTLFYRDDDHALVFGNRVGDGVVQERNIDLGGVFEMRVFPADPILAVARINQDTFIIARTSGLFRFTYVSNSVTFISSLAATALAYDKVSGAILVGLGNQLVTMDPFNGNVLDSRTLPTAIGSILLLTNR